MADANWTSNEPPPERHRGIPKWLWWVGGGCGCALILVVAGGVVAVVCFKKYFDSDAQWEEVAKVLPYDTRPAGVRVFENPLSGAEGVRMWQMHGGDAQTNVVLFDVVPSHAEAMRSALLGAGEQKADTKIFGDIGRFGPEPGKIRVQGRELDCLRYTTRNDDGGKKDEGGFLAMIESATRTSNLVIDVTPERSPRFVAVFIVRQGTNEPVSDETAIAFLEHFRIGPEHGHEHEPR